jgi:diaminohydroxyphosphoribosylaminopyrimidine deaminase/5-amino-6-(5-phosphoribosylamino)uracil reductase
MHIDEFYMQRCFDLAILGAQHAAPNPMVGAVIVHNNRIIGEGYHRRYRTAHAEVNAVASVAPADQHLLPHSTIYISLEPCNIYGHTPPCTQLILQHKIPRVVVSYIDRTPGVDGSGLDLLSSQGVEVVTGVLKQQGKQLSAARNTFVSKNRPYIILKYAQSANGIFAPLDNRQLWLSNTYSKILTHRWRSEVKAILVGKNTVLADNPRLSTRLYPGPHPHRVVIDPTSELPQSAAVFDGSVDTLLITRQQTEALASNKVEYALCPADMPILDFLLHTLKDKKLSPLLVEGGIYTLNQFIEQNYWDEARVFITPNYLHEGRFAPQLKGRLTQSLQLKDDRLIVFKNDYSQSLNFH